MSLYRPDSCSLIRAIFVVALAHSASCIVVPPQDILTHRQERAVRDRRLIIESIWDQQSQREEFSNAVPCIESFLIKSIIEPSRSILLVVDDGEGINEIVHPLTTRLKGRIAFFTHSVDKSLEVPNDIALSTLILMSNGSSVKETFRMIQPCNRGCTFVAVLVTKFDDEESFLLDAEILVQTMWRQRISILTVLARVRDSVLAAGSRKFEPDKYCVPSSPVVLNKCDGGAWKNLKKVAVLNPNRCIYKVAYFEQPPYVVTVNNFERLLGFEGTLTEELTRAQVIERQRAEWSHNTSYMEQTEMLLYDENTKADLVVGRILQQPGKKIGYSVAYDVLQLVWVVPKVPNVSLQGLIQPFHPYIWGAIGGTLLLAGVIKLFVGRDVSWLNIFGLIIGVSIVWRPSNLSGRIQFISWSIFGLFLAQFYVDSLADQLIHVSNFKFESMEELISSSFQIGGTPAFAKLFRKFEQTETIRQIREKLVTFDNDDYEQQFHDLLKGKNASFALLVMLNSSRSEVVETAYAYTMTKDVICSFPLGIASWKGFPYMRLINLRIQMFIVTGIFDTMTKQATLKETRMHKIDSAMEKEYEQELHLNQFVPAFLLIVIGFSSGLLLLILEIVLYPRRILEG